MDSPASTAVATKRRPRRNLTLRPAPKPSWRLQEARQLRGLSLEALALLAKVSVQTAYNAENGTRTPTDATKRALAVALSKVPVDPDADPELVTPTDLWPSILKAMR